MAFPETREGPAPEQLGERHLSFIDAVAQSIGFMGPVFGMAFLTFLVAGAGATGKGAGAATPLSMLFALVGVAAIAWIVAAFARRIRAAGSLYDYVTFAFGDRVGFVAGWVYYLGVTVLAINTVLFLGGLLSDFLASEFDIGIPYWILGLLFVGALFFLLYFGVRISTRAQLVLAGFTMAAVLAFALSIIFRGGEGGNTIEPFTVGASQQGWEGIFFGLLYAILIFTGFETAANLAEETLDPHRAIPRAVLWALGLVGVYFLIVTYSFSIGFGLDGSVWAQDPAALITLGFQYGNTFIARALFILAILDLAAVGVGCSVAASHGLFALARDRRLPAVLARTNRKYGTPAASIIFVLLLSVALVLFVRLTGGFLDLGPAGQEAPEYLPVFLWLAGLGSLCLVVVYAAISLGGLKGLSRYGNRAGMVVAGIVGLAIALGAIWGSIYKVPSPGDKIPWAVGIWIVVGLLYLGALLAMGRFRPALSTLEPDGAEATPAAARPVDET
ncbi:APC family permease [soil metagenome]